MKTPTRIGMGQMVLVLVISRIIVTLTYTFRSSGGGFSNADLLGLLLALPIVLLLALPVILLMKKYPDRNIVECAYDIAKPFGVCISILYAVFFYLIASIAAARFDVFITTTMIPERPTFSFIALIMIAVAYAAAKGLEPLFRAGSIIAVISMATIFILFIALIPRMNFLNYVTPVFDGWGRIWKSALIFTSETIEIIVFIMLAPRTSGKASKGFATFTLVSFGFVFLIVYTVIGVLGNFGQDQLFPFYTAASIAEISVFQHLDALQTSVWLICVFIKSALFIYLCYYSVERLMPKSWKVPFILIVTAVSTISSMLFNPGIEQIEPLFSPLPFGISLLTLGFLLPIVIYIIAGVKRKRRIRS